VPESASELYRLIDLHFSAKLVPTFVDWGCHVIGVTNPYDSILGFLGRSRYYFFQVAPQLYSRGWVDPVPDFFSANLVALGIEPGTSGSVARNSVHYTTEAVVTSRNYKKWTHDGQVASVPIYFRLFFVIFLLQKFWTVFSQTWYWWFTSTNCNMILIWLELVQETLYSNNF
jgi:hypothetical protein